MIDASAPIERCAMFFAFRCRHEGLVVFNASLAESCQSAFKFGSDAILMMDQLAESVFVESIQQHSVSIGERLLPSQRRMPYH